MQVSRAAATYLLINNAYAGAKTIKQIMLMMEPIDETAEDQALSNTRKKALRQEERLLDEIAIKEKVDKKNQMADAGVLILQGQDDGIRCTYLDGTTGVKCVGDGPVDVWLADNNWFGLNVNCAVVANEGYNNEGAFLISQQRHKSDSDIRQSGR